jgi:small-conductance mechanosensitive channel
MVRSRWFLILVAAMFLVAPMSFLAVDSEPSSAVSVSIYGYDVDPLTEEVNINVDSGDHCRITLFIVNKTSNRYSIYVDDESSSDGKVHVKGADLNPTILKPAGSPDSEDIISLAVIITTDQYIYSGDRHVPLKLHLQDLDDSQYSWINMSLCVTVTSDTDVGGSYNKFLGIIPNTLPGVFGEPWFTASVSFIAVIIIVWAISLLLLPLTMAILKVTRRGEDYTQLKKRVLILVSLAAFVLALNRTLLILGVDSEVYYFVETASKVAYTVVGAFIVWDVYVFVILRVVGGLEKRINNEDTSLVPLLKLLGRLVISVVAVSIILSAYGVDLAGVLVSAGVVSLGITLGAQNVLSQFFSGIILLATRPFKKGDFVQIDDDVFIVRKVGLMFTEFNNWGMDKIVTIPNNVVSSSKLFNLTRGNSVARINVYVTVAYDTDIPKAKSLMLEAANSNPDVVLDGSFSKPSVSLNEWLSSGIQLRLSCYVDDFDSSKGIASNIRESITDLFRENDIEIPYSRVQVDILNDANVA